MARGTSGILEFAKALVDVPAADFREVLDHAARELAGPSGVGDPAIVALALREREGRQSTALGDGVALPHARLEACAATALVALRLRSSVPFRAPDGVGVDLVFAMVGPADAPSAHVRVLSRLAKLIRRDGVLDRLRRASDATTFLAALARE